MRIDREVVSSFDLIIAESENEYEKSLSRVPLI